jgi:hypothetical protein
VSPPRTMSISPCERSQSRVDRVHRQWGLPFPSGFGLGAARVTSSIRSGDRQPLFGHPGVNPRPRPRSVHRWDVLIDPRLPSNAPRSPAGTSGDVPETPARPRPFLVPNSKHRFLVSDRRISRTHSLARLNQKQDLHLTSPTTTRPQKKRRNNPRIPCNPGISTSGRNRGTGGNR